MGCPLQVLVAGDGGGGDGRPESYSFPMSFAGRVVNGVVASMKSSCWILQEPGRMIGMDASGAATTARSNQSTTARRILDGGT